LAAFVQETPVKTQVKPHYFYWLRYGTCIDDRQVEIENLNS